MKLSQLSEYDRPMAEFMVESFNPRLFWKQPQKFMSKQKWKWQVIIYTALWLFICKQFPHKYMVIAHKHVYFLWKMIFIKSSELSIVQPLKTCEALDGCFIDNRYIAKYDALEESFSVINMNPKLWW